MSFKTKNKKKSLQEQRVTLQAKHNDKIKEFEDLKKQQILNQEKLNQAKQNYEYYKSKQNNTLTNEELEKKLSLEDTIRELELMLQNQEFEYQDVEYLLDTGSILFSYYNQMNEKIKKNSLKKKPVTVKKDIIHFFKDGSTSSKKSTDVGNELSRENNSPPSKNTTLNFLKNKKDTKERMFEEYSIKIDDQELNISQGEDHATELCIQCGIERKLFMSDGKMICPSCGDERFILIDSDKPSYKEPPRELSYFAYKRINHLNEWLAQFQAKESTDIPQEVYDKILMELKKERMDDISQLKTTKLREILKKLKLNKYYEHVPHIINRLNGVPPPTINRETEEELRRMFKEIQMPFHKFCPKDRKNFLSYSYVLHKFMQLLEMDEFLPCFPLLKSREKLHQQDKIWKEICEHLKWQFIPSV